MLLVIDVGNTNITLGVFNGENLSATFRMTTKIQRTSDEYGIALNELIWHQGFEKSDIDACIVQRIGKSIPEFFAEEGESAFRKLETEVLSEVCRRSGLIISTGGGVVTQACNWDILRQNGKILMLERPIEELSIAGRPVSQSRSVYTLAQERMPLYRSWSDRIVTCVGVQQTAEKIKEELKL